MLVALTLLVTRVLADHYAVITAGSKGYWNYRHQADACHAYHTLRNHGVPAENIITFLYNDCAHARDNPWPGTLYNAAGENPVNYYDGCVVDYSGADVTADNFLSVITGDQAAVAGVGTGRVLKSGAKDHVFLYFVDHGASGLLSFPTTYLYSHQLLSAFSEMKGKGMYNQLVMYVEACESGSMFEGVLDPSLGVYAVTAANATESSWGTYCPPDDNVKGTRLYTCLGDLFSVNWLQNSDSSNINSETLSEQFKDVQTLTTKSHVSAFGDQSFSKEYVGIFIGEESAEPKEFSHTATNYWDARNAELNYFYAKYAANSSAENAAELMERVNSRQQFLEIFEEFSTFIGPPVMNDNMDSLCIQSAVESFEVQCMKFSEFGLQFVKELNQACRAGYTKADFQEVFSSICSPELIRK